MNRCERCDKTLLPGERLTSIEVEFHDYGGVTSDKRELGAQLCARCFEEVESAITWVLRVRSMFPGAIGRTQSADAEPTR
jgi:hypothetical protein